MKAQDNDKIRRQIELVQQWRASGQSKIEWAASHGMDAKVLMGWITYEGRWRARLNGQPTAARKRSETSNQTQEFEALHVRSLQPTEQAPVQPTQTDSQTIRIECKHSCLTLHWPVSHSSRLLEFLEERFLKEGFPQGLRP